MFSLQRIFGKGDKFFDLLEASAEEVKGSVQALVKIIQTPEPSISLEDFADARRKDKRITEEISEQLVKTFVTGLEREDIEALSIALYKITKTTEKFAERYKIVASQMDGAEFMRQTELIITASDTLVLMVKHLRKIPPLEKIKELNDRLQHAEGEADKIMLELLKDLYHGKHEPLKALIVHDLYELLEKVVDRCRDAGNVVSHIVLKNS
ncbi:MAG: DUF47 family protein [Verrucomicrobia bacterium]|nr:DUF47 family protein [Verrucomicrobiota bacterium]